MSCLPILPDIVFQNLNWDVKYICTINFCFTCVHPLEEEQNFKRDSDMTKQQKGENNEVTG